LILARPFQGRGCHDNLSLPVAERRLILARPFKGREKTCDTFPVAERRLILGFVVPQITFVVINAVLLQKFQVLFLKAHLAMMLALILDIALHIQHG
jgi:hypothetical protein